MLKNLTMSLNEAEYKMFKAQANKRNVTPYALHKKIVKDFLERKRRDYIEGSLLTYALFLYSLVATTIILVF